MTAFVQQSESAQQSSREDKISLQQKDPTLKYLLSFANAQQQYWRKTRKAVRDLKAGRGNKLSNAIQIFNYAIMQSVLFYAAQNLEWPFGDDAEEEEKEKMMMSISENFLRGGGVLGQGVMVLAKTLYVELAMNGYDHYGTKTEDMWMQMIPALTFYSKNITKATKAIGEVNQYRDKQSLIDLTNAGLEFTPVGRKVKKEVQAVDVIQQVPDLSYLERALLLIGWNEYNLGLKN